MLQSTVSLAVSELINQILSGATPKISYPSLTKTFSFSRKWLSWKLQNFLWLVSWSRFSLCVSAHKKAMLRRLCCLATLAREHAGAVTGVAYQMPGLKLNFWLAFRQDICAWKQDAKSLSKEILCAVDWIQHHGLIQHNSKAFKL